MRLAGYLLTVSCLLSLMPCWAGVNDDFRRALKNGNFSDVEELVRGGADVNLTFDNGKTPLMVAAKHGQSELVTALLASGADVNATNDNGGTALMFSAIRGDLPTIEALLSHGADTNALAKFRWTALMIASVKGHAGVVRILLKHGADGNARDVYGWTPLMRAVYENRGEAVAVLLEDASIDVNNRDDQGITALHLAAVKGDAVIARMLIEHGADPGAVNLEGKTPVAIAQSRGHEETVDVMSDSLLE